MHLETTGERVGLSNISYPVSNPRSPVGIAPSAERSRNWPGIETTKRIINADARVESDAEKKASSGLRKEFAKDLKEWNAPTVSPGRRKQDWPGLSSTSQSLGLSTAAPSLTTTTAAASTTNEANLNTPKTQRDWPHLQHTAENLGFPRENVPFNTPPSSASESRPRSGKKLFSNMHKNATSSENEPNTTSTSTPQQSKTPRQHTISSPIVGLASRLNGMEGVGTGGPETYNLQDKPRGTCRRHTPKDSMNETIQMSNNITVSKEFSPSVKSKQELEYWRVTQANSVDRKTTPKKENIGEMSRGLARVAAPVDTIGEVLAGVAIQSPSKQVPGQQWKPKDSMGEVMTDRHLTRYGEKKSQQFEKEARWGKWDAQQIDQATHQHAAGKKYFDKYY